MYILVIWPLAVLEGARKSDSDYHVGIHIRGLMHYINYTRTPNVVDVRVYLL